MDFWNLIEFFDEIDTRLKVIDKLDKFLRSVRYDGHNETSFATEYMATDFDTPESIAAKDRIDPQNDWIDIYIKNRKLETDYRAEEGGYNLTLGRQNLTQFNIESVVDNLIGDRVYGIDFDREFLFEDDDIKILTPRQTFVQSVDVLAFLKRADIPEYFQLGVEPDLTVGSNLGAISAPFITRQLQDSFSTDDTMLGFKVNDIKIEGTSVFIKYQVESFFNFITENSLEVK